MAVVSRYLSSSLRFRNTADETIQTLHRVRPNIDAMQVEFLQDGINAIAIPQAVSAALSIQEELVEQ